MRNKLALIVCAFALCSCQKKEGGPTTGTLPGSCSYAVSDYHGAINPVTVTGGAIQRQIISVNSDVTAQPMDRLYVTLCRNADCLTNVPAIQCPSLPITDTTTPCVRTMPATYIGLAPHEVILMNAGTGNNAGGFTNYSIHEEVCQ